MSLELLIGPMFAGKSSAIQSIVRRHQALGWPVFVITHTSDTRYSDKPAIVNHDGVVLPAYATASLHDALDNADFIIAKLVVIEEAQFFCGLVSFVLHAVEKLKKHVVVVGLDGDVLRRPFGKILELVPFCDKVTKLTAMCKVCGDGTAALFSHATTDAAVTSAELGVPCVGAADKYTALCRRHYLVVTGDPVVPTYDFSVDANGC